MVCVFVNVVGCLCGCVVICVVVCWCVLCALLFVCLHVCLCLRMFAYYRDWFVVVPACSNVGVRLVVICWWARLCVNACV